MPADFVPNAAEYFRVLPEILLVAVATLIMVLEPITAKQSKRALGWIALAGLVAALAPAALGELTPGTAFSGMVTIDGFAVFFRLLVIAAAIVVVLMSFSYLRREDAESGEYYALILYSAAGQCIMAAAAELIVVFIGLEISSIASYVLAGYLRRSKLANEAAAKYFLLGSFATAFLLYGIALIYGATGTTSLAGIRMHDPLRAHPHAVAAPDTHERKVGLVNRTGRAKDSSIAHAEQAPDRKPDREANSARNERPPVKPWPA